MRPVKAWQIAGVLMLSAVVLPLAADSNHDTPDPDAGGGIVGSIKQDAKTPHKLQEVIAVEPFECRAYQAKLDRATGKFRFHGLPPGEYDLLIKTVGHIYEGITLEEDPDQKPTPDELKQMCKGVGETWSTSEDFFNRKKIVRLTGDGQRVRMLGVHTRTKHVYAQSGATIEAQIRRIDLVTMIKTHKVWQLETGRHLLRQEVPYESKDIEIGFTYSPELGGLLVGEDVEDVGQIDLRKLPKIPPGRYATADYEGE